MTRLFGWFCVFAFAAALPPVFAQADKPEVAMIPADPAMWTVHGPKGTAYLLGSIHLLPSNIAWQTQRISAALKAADTFVFEIPLDASTQTEAVTFIQKNGTLPAGTTLSSLLDPKARADYDDAVKIAHVDPAVLENKRPWLAMIVLDLATIKQQNLSPASGIDQQVYAIAQTEGGKSYRAFETPEQQFEFFMPKNQKLEVEEFDVALKEFKTDRMNMGQLIDAWSHGDQKALEHIASEGFKGHADVEKSLLSDRNKNWIGQIEKMLAEPHTYFITVGAGHLLGPKGLPALLRAKGYKVD
jgi:uncharacterized protein YbaP (TraB family)